jgi:hypothetical protein
LKETNEDGEGTYGYGNGRGKKGGQPLFVVKKTDKGAKAVLTIADMEAMPPIWTLSPSIWNRARALWCLYSPPPLRGGGWGRVS